MDTAAGRPTLSPGGAWRLSAADVFAAETAVGVQPLVATGFSQPSSSA